MAGATLKELFGSSSSDEDINEHSSDEREANEQQQDVLGEVEPWQVDDGAILDDDVEGHNHDLFPNLSSEASGEENEEQGDNPLVDANATQENAVEAVEIASDDEDVVVVDVRRRQSLSNDEVVVTDSHGMPIVPPSNVQIIDISSDTEESSPKRIRPTSAPIVPSGSAHPLPPPLTDLERQGIVETARAQLRCPLCTDPFENMTSTICGHLYCNECITIAVRRLHHCPLCQQYLTRNDLHPIFL